MSYPWTFKTRVLGVAVMPPRFAPDARLVCRVQDMMGTVCVATSIKHPTDDVTTIEATYEGRDDKTVPLYEFGWLADSAFMPLVAA